MQNNKSENKERQKLRNWLILDKKIAELWFRLIEYSILIGLLYYTGEKTGILFVKLCFYISAFVIWWIIDGYTSYFFEPYLLNNERSFLFKQFILILSTIFSSFWIWIVVSVAISTGQL